MGEIVIREVEPGDAERLEARLRPQDRREVSAMGFADTPAEIIDVIERSIRQCRGYALAAEVDGDLICIWGVVTRSALAAEGYPWLLATDLTDRPEIRRAFARRSWDSLMRVIPPGVVRLFNFVDEGNELSIGWLKWMGFSFGADRYDFNGVRWVRFGMVAKDVH